MMFLGSLLDQAIEINAGYSAEAQSVLEEAVKLSPTKQMVSFQLAQHYIVTGKNDAATDLLYRVWKFAPAYKVAAVHAWVLAVATHKTDIANEIATMYSPAGLSENDLLRLGEGYRRIQDYPHALPFYGQIVVVAPENAKYHATYAALLANAGRTKEARAQAQEAIRLDPSLAKEAGIFLQDLNQ